MCRCSTDYGQLISNPEIRRSWCRPRRRQTNYPTTKEALEAGSMSCRKSPSPSPSTEADEHIVIGTKHAGLRLPPCGYTRFLSYAINMNRGLLLMDRVLR